MSPENAVPDLYFADLFERTRQRLAEQLGQSAGTVLGGPGALPDLGDGPAPRVIAQLRLDPETQQVVVRFCDGQTGATIRELTPALVALAATRPARTT